MISKLGTCMFAEQFDVVEHQPATAGDRAYSEAWPEAYRCNWLDWTMGDVPMPPAIARWKLGFELKSGDCESCPHYQPAGGNMLTDLLRAKGEPAKKVRQRRVSRPARHGKVTKSR